MVMFSRMESQGTKESLSTVPLPRVSDVARHISSRFFSGKRYVLVSTWTKVGMMEKG
jgi:hypothetical protein